MQTHFHSVRKCARSLYCAFALPYVFFYVSMGFVRQSRHVTHYWRAGASRLNGKFFGGRRRDVDGTSTPHAHAPTHSKRRLGERCGYARRVNVCRPETEPETVSFLGKQPQQRSWNCKVSSYAASHAFCSCNKKLYRSLRKAERHAFAARGSRSVPTVGSLQLAINVEHSSGNSLTRHRGGT